MNKKGFTLIELTISIVLLSLIMVFMFNFLGEIRKNEDSIEDNTNMIILRNDISKYINEDIRNNLGIKDIKCCIDNICTYECSNNNYEYGLHLNSGKIKRISLQKSNDNSYKILEYDDITDISDVKKELRRKISNKYSFNPLIYSDQNDLYFVRIPVALNPEFNIELSSKKNNNIVFYDVTLNIINGSVDETTKKAILNGTIMFTVVADDGYVLEASSLSCNNGSTVELSNGKVKVSKVTGNDVCTVTLKKEFINPYTRGTFTYKILANNSDISERTDFLVTFTENTTGKIFKQSSSTDSSTGQFTEDLNGDGIGEDVYYFAGNTTSNWVKFAGFYWRIIRVNENGSVRLLYSGTSPDTTSGHIGNERFYSVTSATEYEGRGSYPPYAGSQVQSDLTTWFNSNLKSDYSKYITTKALFCWDNSGSKGSFTYGTICNYPESYGAFQRLVNNKRPSYLCGGTVTGTKGKSPSNSAVNGTSYNIGLMTADEMVFAGGLYNTAMSSPYAWFYTNSNGNSIVGNSSSWLLSPSNFSCYNNEVSNQLFIQDSASKLSRTGFSSNAVIRPVINLKYCTSYASGNGTSTSPYEVKISDSCAGAEN